MDWGLLLLTGNIIGTVGTLLKQYHATSKNNISRRKIIKDRIQTSMMTITINTNQLSPIDTDIYGQRGGIHYNKKLQDHLIEMEKLKESYQKL